MADDFDARALVPAALGNDNAAAGELVRRLYPLVAKIVRSHRPQRAAEEDLCQMIFIRMFQKLPQFSGAVPLEHWVSRIAVNTCLNQISAEKARPEVRRADLTEEQEAVVDNLAATSDELGADAQLAARDLVAYLLDRLKPAERLVIDLIYLQGKSVEEVREITGWSRPLVKVRAFRARQRLKEYLSRIRQNEKNETA
ncbi:MAG: sigma-70 family RNA polymerase sigma factor [Verrucomicrobiota bacterium]|nr:sigma-70 family RNA polymerase sigma factor [Verrucomicrobiota bacterium]